MEDNNVLSIDGIYKKFGEVEILKDIHAQIKPGMITAFVGPNGAGKTTLFHIITGNLSADKGKIFMGKKNVTGLKPFEMAHLGLTQMFQDLRVFSDMSAIENILVALMEKHEKTPWWTFTHFYCLKDFLIKHKAEALYYLEKIGLSEFANKKVEKMSYGQQKLIALARIMAREPRYILLDEPTSGLSPVMVEQMTTLIKNLVKERNISVGLIEHNMQVVRKLSDYIYFLNEGQVYLHGSAKKVLNNSEVKRIYIGLGKDK
ncbi:MAG: ABC transporter ATP-binding protein [Alphaproteobacteria bacterium]|nr:ABC transporter ATP-binding protein [Alphaproteobacteria bacterium]